MKKFVLVVLLGLSVQGIMAQSGFKTTQINVFKNGTYFVVKEGSLAVKDKTAVFEAPQAPLLGTFWLTTTRENKISSVVFVNDTLKKRRSALSYYDLLSSNKGKKIRLVYKATDKDLREISGILSDFIKSSGLVKIKQQENKFIFIPYTGIVEMGFDDTPVDMINADSVARLAKVKFNNNISSADVKLNYMHAGIQWLPSYNIKIINEKELQLEMKALVENYSETIENADLTLTVGNPQFFYGTKTDPLAFNSLTNLYDTRSTTAAYNFQAQMYSNVMYAEERTVDVAYNDYSTVDAEGEKTNDLYMYKLGKVTLPNQSKTEFQIFSQNVPYKDVYEVSIGDVVNYASYNYISNDPEKRFDVYHSLLITNTTRYPFTTAVVFVQNENLQPLAQDRIKYTPTGASVSVQLSKAGDVVVKNKEEEIAKAENVKKVGKNFYHKVTIKGVIYIENLQDKKIQLNVNKSLTALINSASDGGKISKTGKYSALNPYSKIDWEISLNGKEKKSLIYEYEVYINAGTGN